MSPPAADDATRGERRDANDDDGASFEYVDVPPGDTAREWEAFVREEADEPLRHVGSVSAPSADVASEQATALFGWSADAIWLCPADETVRLATDGGSLGDRADDASVESGTESGSEQS